MQVIEYMAGVIVLIMIWALVEAIHYNRKLNKKEK